MRRKLLSAIAVFCVLQSPLAVTPSAPALAQSAVDEASFVAAAKATALLQIESSALALEQATTKEVRSFAQKALELGNIAEEKLSAIAGEASFSPAAEARHHRTLDQLSVAPAESFDQAYLDLQVQTKRTAVALCTSYLRGGEDEDLRAFAAEWLSSLQERLAEGQELARGM